MTRYLAILALAISLAACGRGDGGDGGGGGSGDLCIVITGGEWHKVGTLEDIEVWWCDWCSECSDANRDGDGCWIGDSLERCRDSCLPQDSRCD